MPRLTVFHIFYSSTFTLLFLLLSALLLIPPGDAIAQSLLSTPRQLYNVFIIAGCYLLVAVISLALYLSRVISTRRSISQIPSHSLKLPSKRFGELVAWRLEESLRVAAEARPKEVVEHSGWPPPKRELGDGPYREWVEAVRDVVVGDRKEDGWTVRECLADREEAEEFVALYERVRFRRKGRGIETAVFWRLMEAAGEAKVADRERGWSDGDGRSLDYTESEAVVSDDGQVNWLNVPGTRRM